MDESIVDYSGDISYFLDEFEKALVERWQQEVNDAVWRGYEVPPNLHRQQGLGSEVPWNHLTPEIVGHISNQARNLGGCQYLNWFAGGRNGKVQSVTCDGKISEPGGEPVTVEWNGTQVKLPQSTYCGIGELFAAAEEWAWADRKIIFDALPPFDLHNLPFLQDARDALAEMYANFGGDTNSHGYDPAFTPAWQAPTLANGFSLPYYVNQLDGSNENSIVFQEIWAGTAADTAKHGFFATTVPTLTNHALIAHALSTLVNQRATIVHTYQNCSIGLVKNATAALGAKSSETVDLAVMWKVVNGVGIAVGLCSFGAAGQVSAGLQLAAFLGTEFLSTVNTPAEFTQGPGEVAKELYDNVQTMNGNLATSEDNYAQSVASFRGVLNATHSFFLELYDFGQNTPAAYD